MCVGWVGIGGGNWVGVIVDAGLEVYLDPNSHQKIQTHTNTYTSKPFPIFVINQPTKLIQSPPQQTCFSKIKKRGTLLVIRLIKQNVHE